VRNHPGSYREAMRHAYVGNPFAAYALARRRPAGFAARWGQRLMDFADERVTEGEFVVSERLVENPLVAIAVGSVPQTVLDFGGYEGSMALQLAALGHDVTVMDQRSYPFEHPNISAVTADIFDSGVVIEPRYDVIYSISTVEHLGLGYYGDKVVEDGDAAALAKLWEGVRPGGRLLATVPAGKPTVCRGYRTYDGATIERVFPAIDAVRWFKKPGREGMWVEVQEHEVVGLEYEKPAASRPCEAVAFVSCQKADEA
jgi:hypothetical protein